MIPQYWKKKRTRKKKIPVSLIPRVLQPSQGCPGVSETNENTFEVNIMRAMTRKTNK